MKRKLILFDWGNIVESYLTGYTFKKAWVDLFRRCGAKEKDDEKIYSSLSKYKLSSITNDKDFEKTFDMFATEHTFNVTYDEFKRLYNEYFEKVDYYKDVAEYEVSLRDKCAIGILSNLTILDKERLDKQVNLSKYDYVFLSFELGCRKPEVEIYEKVQEKLQFNKEDILFIDDKKGNIEAAKSFGWNVFQVTGLELDKIKEACEKFINC